jgi:hypothetical protein
MKRKTMTAAGDLERLADLDGVLDVALYEGGGAILRASASSEELEVTAGQLATALDVLEAAQGASPGGMTLTVEYAGGVLHGFRMQGKLLVVHAAPGANHGAIRQDMRRFIGQGAD